jgi:hypothetical protein
MLSTTIEKRREIVLGMFLGERLVIVVNFFQIKHVGKNVALV